MLVTLQGTYENGAINLDEPVSPDLTGRVLVTFLPNTPSAPNPSVPQDSSASTYHKAALLLKAIELKQPRFSFDEALAMPVKAGSSVSDAVTQEREQSNW